MAGIRKREIVGLILVVALFGAVASPALALTPELGQTSVSTDTAAGDAVPDTGKAIAETASTASRTIVDASPATGSGSGTGRPAAQTDPAEPQPTPDPAPVNPVPKAVTSLTDTAPGAVDTIQKDASAIAGAVAGGGKPAAPAVLDEAPANLGGALADATATLTDTASMLTRDPVGTASALVDGVQKDSSQVVGTVAGGAITHVNQTLDPVTAILKDPVLLVSATVQQPLAATRGLPDLPASGSPPQLGFAGSPPGPGQPPPGAHAGGAEPAATSSPADAAPAILSAGPLSGGEVIARGSVADLTYSGATARGVGSEAGTISVGGIARSIRSLPLLGVGSGSAAGGDRTGAPLLPAAPPRPELPALGGVSFSISLSFGSFAALAVVLASIVAHARFTRRLALAGRRPVGFALLLERPG